MSTYNAILFLKNVFDGLQEVSADLISFLQTAPLAEWGYDWTWGGIMFGTALTAFLAFAIGSWFIRG